MAQIVLIVANGPESSRERLPYHLTFWRRVLLSFNDFLHLGQEQRLLHTNVLFRTFFRCFGPLGLHARIRNAHVLQLVETTALPSDAYVLDVGCGHAYTLFWLARRHSEWKLYGVDIDKELITNNNRIARALGLTNLFFYQGDVTRLKTDFSCDLILAVDVLEHLEEDITALLSWRRLLSPTGWLILHLPLRHQMQKRVFPIFKQHIVSDHVRDEYTVEEIGAKLREAGFCIYLLKFSFGFWGELAFELNYLFWQYEWLRNLIAFLTFPLAVSAGYLDIRCPPQQGNSFIVIARPVQEEETLCGN